MPTNRAGVSLPVLFSGGEKLWVSPFGTARYTATLSRRCHHPYCSQLEKAVGVCLATTKGTISHAFVLYRELVTELSHAGLDNKFTDRIALICPSLPPADN